LWQNLNIGEDIFIYESPNLVFARHPGDLAEWMKEFIRLLRDKKLL
jgi:hypothetical protein